MATNLGLIDIFSLLGKMSRRLQKVELFPWEISQIQDELVSTLRQMSNIKLIKQWLWVRVYFVPVTFAEIQEMRTCVQGTSPTQV